MRDGSQTSAGAGAPFLEFAALSLERGGRPLFDNLSLSLRERRVGLIGHNGAGKSTLLRLAAGLIAPRSGEVRLNGRPLGGDRDLPSEIGFLFQNPDHQLLFPTVGEEVSFGLIEQGMDPAAADARARALLAAHGCAGWEKRAVHELSDGEKQLVCLVAVLATGPSVLLLDEPFSSLDLPTRLDMRRRLSELDQNVLVASHDFELLADFDRVIWLESGRIRGDGTPAYVLAAYEASIGGTQSRARSA